MTALPTELLATRSYNFALLQNIHHNIKRRRVLLGWRIQLEVYSSSLKCQLIGHNSVILTVENVHLMFWIGGSAVNFISFLPDYLGKSSKESFLLWSVAKCHYLLLFNRLGGYLLIECIKVMGANLSDLVLYMD